MIRSQQALKKSLRLRSPRFHSRSYFANSLDRFDIAVIGGGISGASAAARLQANGFSTCILESHHVIGGCAGYYQKDEFSFDVGATTFVDFEKGGVGGEFLESIGMACPIEQSEVIPGYKFHLPSNEVGPYKSIRLFRDSSLFDQECKLVFGDSSNVNEFWKIMNELSTVFWEASRKGIKMPLQNVSIFSS